MSGIFKVVKNWVVDKVTGRLGWLFKRLTGEKFEIMMLRGEAGPPGKNGCSRGYWVVRFCGRDYVSADCARYAAESIANALYWFKYLGVYGDSDMVKKVLRMKESPKKAKERKCRVCGCTEGDCRQCVEAQGHPCHWVQEDLCSRCVSVNLVGGVPLADGLMPPAEAAAGILTEAVKRWEMRKPALVTDEQTAGHRAEIDKLLNAIALAVSALEGGE